MALEWLVEVTYPAGPEASSTICWAGGQLLGGVFIVVSDALQAEEGEGEPRGNMGRALVFMAVVAGAAVMPAMLLGVVGRVRMGRGDVDKVPRRASGGP